MGFSELSNTDILVWQNLPLPLVLKNMIRQIAKYI